MKLEDKGPLAPAPRLTGMIARVNDAITSWPGVTAHAHWDLYQPDRIDGADYYVGKEELGHMHLGGEAHIATTRALVDVLIREKTAEPFRYQMDPTYAGWCQVSIETDTDAKRAIAAFLVNYQRLAAGAGALQ